MRRLVFAAIDLVDVAAISRQKNIFCPRKIDSKKFDPKTVNFKKYKFQHKIHIFRIDSDRV